MTDPNKPPLFQQLADGIAQLNIHLRAEQQNQLFAYLQLFEKWNKAYNLSAIRRPEEMISKHLLDSLSVVPFCMGENWLDVGTGGGLPGIPLAIAFPDKHFTLLDSNGKKTRFLFQVLTELGLDNVTIVQDRVENFRSARGFDGVISRAFADVNDMLRGCRHLLAEQGRIYAMKGQYPAAELEKLAAGFTLEQVHELKVPACDGQRHLLVFSPDVENKRTS